MNRREARELAMKCIFQMEAQREFTTDNAELFLKDKVLGDQSEYIYDVLNNVCAHQEEIDLILNEHSKGWPVSRMTKTDLAIVRLAACEIMYMENLPKAVAINEAVDMAKIYGTDQSPKFINAVLKNVQP